MSGCGTTSTNLQVCNIDFDAPALPLLSTVGYEGKVPSGLHSDPCGQFLVYAIGANVIKSDTRTGQQTFLIGHGNNVTALDVDRTGRFIASGAMNYMGFKTEVIIWDFFSGCKLGQYNAHMTRVNAVKFSYDGRYLMSVGNMDDGQVFVFDTEKCKVVACAKTHGFPRCIAAANSRNDAWVVAGDEYLAWWVLDTKENRLRFEKAYMKLIKRDVLCIDIDGRDEFAYAGTSTGDILKVKLNLPAGGGYRCDQPEKLGPPTPGPALTTAIGRIPHKNERGRNNHLYKGGVTALKILDSGTFLLGAGNGKVTQAKLVIACSSNTGKLAPARDCAHSPGALERVAESGAQLMARGQITSLLALGDQGSGSGQVVIGSSKNEIYFSGLGCLDAAKMLVSAPTSVVNDISFPMGFDGVFASASFEDVRLWNSSCSMRELLRINVANMTCHAVIFSRSGKSIITAWNDSHIRTYSSQSATPLWVIHHAHLRGVTALGISCDDRMLITGGEEGQVRVWSICPQQMTPIHIMKEHIGPVTSLRLKNDDSECATSSGDGSIIIWCLKMFVRKALVLQDTLFLDVAWHPSGCQLLGVTHNHKLCYFEAFDGAVIREVEASEGEPVLSVDVSSDGLYVVTGGADRQVRLWSYKETKLLRKGVVHSAEVTRVRFSPCDTYILSCCQDGSIFKWDFPKDLACVSVHIQPVCPMPCNAKLDQPAITAGRGAPRLPVGNSRNAIL